MSRVTSKLQVTIPKAVAEAHGIRPGSDIVFESAGESVRVWLPGRLRRPRRGRVAWQLRLYDSASRRQQERNRQVRARLSQETATGARGWTREELYDRGVSR